MHRIIIIITVLLSNAINAQECKYLGQDKEFKGGDVAYLFGDSVKLRTMPSFTSESIDVLKIGSRVEILERTTETSIFQGLEYPWYKVRYEKEVGYIIGGQISQIEIKNEDLRCFVSLELEDSSLYILIRVLSDSNATYFENKSDFHGDNYGFCLKLYDNRGVQGIRNILFVNYLPESGGANAGGYYLFFDGTNLSKVIDVTSRGDIGFWERENLYFPQDSIGVQNKIIYIKEKGQYSGLESEKEDPYWEFSKKLRIELEWIHDKLEPDPRSFNSKGYKK